MGEVWRINHNSPPTNHCVFIFCVLHVWLFVDAMIVAALMYINDEQNTLVAVFRLIWRKLAFLMNEHLSTVSLSSVIFHRRMTEYQLPCFVDSPDFCTLWARVLDRE